MLVVIRRPGKCGPLLIKAENVITWDVCGNQAPFFSVFLGKSSSQVPEGKGRDWENEELPAAGNQFQNLLRKQEVHKSREPHEMYSQVMRELVKW